GNAVPVGVVDMAGCRGDQAEVREGGERRLGRLAAPDFALAAEIATEQQRDVAMIAEQYVRLTDQSGQDGPGIAVPAAPEPVAVIAVERDGDTLLPRRFGGGDGRLGRSRSECRRDARQVQQASAGEQRIPVEILRPGQREGAA